MLKFSLVDQVMHVDQLCDASGNILSFKCEINFFNRPHKLMKIDKEENRVITKDVGI